MAGYGSWDDRPWERRAGAERDWRGERQRWGEGDPRGARDEERGREEGRARPAWRGGEEDRPWGRREWERGERGWDPAERRFTAGEERRGRGGTEEERWERGGSEGERWGGRGYGGGDARPEIDPPWVERGPGARARGETRGLVEWEDRGPLAWLGDRLRRGGRASRGPKGYTRSDERIHEEVCERIARSGVAADEVEVRVENREVTLTGTVHDRREKWWLEDLTDDVFGVEEVHNHLRVARPEPGARGEGGGVRH